jgi:cobalt-zinc-cadmium efflux system outer membrane protein
LPLRQAVADQALLHYNGMFISLYQLVAVKQGEVEARRGYLEALRDYWKARAELARAVGGGLPVEPPRAEAGRPTPPPANAAPQPAPSVPAPSEGNHQHEH